MTTKRALSCLATALFAGALLFAAMPALGRPHTPPPPRPLDGTVLSVDSSGNVLVATEGRNSAQVIVATDANTVVTIDGKASAVANLFVGMDVKVLPPTGVATSIVAHSEPLNGTVVSVDSSGNVVVQVGGASGVKVTVATDANTVVTIDRVASKVANLTAGMIVRVVPLTGVATSISAQSPPPLFGDVVSVDTTTGNVVVSIGCGKSATQVTVATDANTVVTIDGVSGTVANLTVGMDVKVLPPTGVATSIVAKSEPIFGTVDSVDSSGNVVVATSGAGSTKVTVATDKNTVVTVDGVASAVANLTTGMNVQVILSAGVATRITAHSPPPLCGVVVSVDTTTGNVVVATGCKGGTQVTVATDANTVITINGAVSTVANLAPGMLVRVVPPTGTATSITAYSPPAPQSLCGSVVSVDTTTGNVTVSTLGGTQVVVATNSVTVVTIDGKISTVANLTAGMLVVVRPATGIATSIAAHTPPPYGTIVSTDPTTGNFVVATGGMGGLLVTVATNSSTVFKINGKPGTFAGLAAGMWVSYKPATGVTTSVIAVTPPKFVPPIRRR